jgi:hypothetical protein
VAIKLEVSKADLVFEGGFPKPEFALLRDGTALLDHLYRRLERYGLRLADMRFERGTGNAGDQHLLVHLFDYRMTVRIRLERIEVTCSDLPETLVEKFKAAILDVLGAVTDYKPDLAFRAFAVAVGLHAKLVGQPVREYLARFVTNAPSGLGPSTGSGVVFYFGPENGRLLATVTVDLSAVVADGLFIRLHGVWDGKRITADELARSADTFVRDALGSFGLQLPA